MKSECHYFYYNQQCEYYIEDQDDDLLEIKEEEDGIFIYDENMKKHTQYEYR